LIVEMTVYRRRLPWIATAPVDDMRILSNRTFAGRKFGA
jgi:hypothetical protein